LNVVGNKAPPRRNRLTGRLKKNPATKGHRVTTAQASSILTDLRGGDLRSKGRSDQIASRVIKNPLLFRELFAGMHRGDSQVVRLRAADAIEKVTRLHPEHLRPYKRTLMAKVSNTDEPGVRWHVAQLLPRLNLTRKDLPRALAILYAYINDPSRIVATFAMQALADLAKQFPHLLPEVVPELRHRARFGSPAMRARGRKLLAEFEGGIRSDA